MTIGKLVIGNSRRTEFTCSFHLTRIPFEVGVHESQSLVSDVMWLDHPFHSAATEDREKQPSLFEAREILNQPHRPESMKTKTCRPVSRMPTVDSWLPAPNNCQLIWPKGESGCHSSHSLIWFPGMPRRDNGMSEYARASNEQNRVVRWAKEKFTRKALKSYEPGWYHSCRRHIATGFVERFTCNAEFRGGKKLENRKIRPIRYHRIHQRMVEPSRKRRQLSQILLSKYLPTGIKFNRSNIDNSLLCCDEWNIPFASIINVIHWEFEWEMKRKCIVCILPVCRTGMIDGLCEKRTNLREIDRFYLRVYFHCRFVHIDRATPHPTLLPASDDVRACGFYIDGIRRGQHFFITKLDSRCRKTN